MMAWLTTWWVWIGIGLIAGIVEVLVPAFLFLGFAIAAVIMAVLVGIGVFVSAGFSSMMAVYAGLSLLAWIGLRFAFRNQSSGAKVFTKDVND